MQPFSHQNTLDNYPEVTEHENNSLDAEILLSLSCNLNY